MAKVPNGMNSDYVEYFPLAEYVRRIKLAPIVLEHLQDTTNEFCKYLDKMYKFDEEYMNAMWIYSLYTELEYSKKIENVRFDKIDLMNESVFFDTLNISNKRIHGLHNFITRGEDEPVFDYRKTDVNVSRYTEDGREEIFWRGARYQDINKFMSDFIEIYKHRDASLLMSNPFLKSSLIHLLFLRIHPYTDGNGRTARLLHNVRFTDSVNKLYGTSLRISPLNLSESIYLNKRSYVNAIDSIYFDLKHDNNDAINSWFQIMLYLADEQILASNDKLEDIDMYYFKEEQEKENCKVRSKGIKK